MSVASYPHIKMGVRDESIYVGLDTEVMPLDMPLYMMRAQKGPVGVPVWCPTYTYACQVFGSDTFNKRSTYFSESAYFLLKTLVSNGAFIMRLTEDAATNARVYIECGVSKSEYDVPQWKRSINGRFVTEIDGSKIPLNDNGEACRELTNDATLAASDPENYVLITAENSAVYAVTDDAKTIVNKKYYYQKFSAYEYAAITGTTFSEDKVVFVGAGTPVYTKCTDRSQIGLDTSKFWYVLNGTTYTLADGITPETADEEKEYYTISYPNYTATVVKSGAAITAGTYYSRSTAEDATKEYVEITNVAAGSRIDQTLGAFFNASTGALVAAFGGSIYESLGSLAVGDKEPQVTIKGRKIVWRASLQRGEYKTVNGVQVWSYASMTDTDTREINNGSFTWYPMLTMLAKTPGKWGEAFGIRMFYDAAQNTLAQTLQNGAVKYCIAPVELKYGDTTPTAIVDGYGSSVVTGTMREDCVDPTTDLEICLKKLVPGQYSGSRELPIQMNFMEENWNKVGKIILKAELAAKASAKALYPDLFAEKDVEILTDKLFGEDVTADEIDAGEKVGHMANIISAIDPNKVPYFGSVVVGTYDEATKETITTLEGEKVADMNDLSQIYLDGGADGVITDYAIERYTRAQIEAAVAQTQDYLIDYLRCPFNNIIDTGVSLATKKSYLDFMGIRDNLTVFLCPQQTWKNEDGSTPAELTRYEDESVGAALRSYALLMREDVENATEANRCIIFLANGTNSDHDGLIPSTLWIALKNAEYLNKEYIDQEPVERPNSEIKCFEEFAWTAAAEETRARCWNAGLNYAQYCDQNTIHYASVRSVYRYDTSVLTDATTVRAVTFCKDIIRREWAIWAGSKRKADDLNSRITKELNAKITKMLNGKYEAEATVYQTDEDKKYGFVRHVDLTLTSPAQNRVWLATIIVRREGYDASAED